MHLVTASVIVFLLDRIQKFSVVWSSG